MQHKFKENAYDPVHDYPTPRISLPSLSELGLAPPQTPPLTSLPSLSPSLHDSASSISQSPSPELPSRGLPKRFPCPHCDKTFTRKYNMQSHLLCHTDDRPFKCDQCTASFVRKHDLRRHCRSIHSQVKPFACPNCSMSFARSDGLRRHLEAEMREA